MSSAELAARLTAARAVLADYRREQADEDMVGLAAWSARLAGVLGEVLNELDRTDTEGGESQLTALTKNETGTKEER